MVKFVVGQVQTTTRVKPNDAATLDWANDREPILVLRAIIEEKAHMNRTYPEIVVGDRVKILRKPGKYSEFKSGFVAWTKETHKVERIGFESEQK